MLAEGESRGSGSLGSPKLVSGLGRLGSSGASAFPWLCLRRFSRPSEDRCWALVISG